VTVFGRPNHLSISPNLPGQLSLLPLAGREMSTDQSAVIRCGWGVKAGWLIPSADKRTCGWQIKPCDPSLTRANLSNRRISHMHVHCVLCVVSAIVFYSSK